MKLKSICLCSMLCLSSFFSLPVQAEEADEIVPYSVEYWYGTDRVAAGDGTIVYIAASISYSNGSWTSRAWYNGYTGSSAPTVTVTKTGVSITNKTVSYNVTIQTSSGTYTGSGTVRVYAE